MIYSENNIRRAYFGDGKDFTPLRDDLRLETFTPEEHQLKHRNELADALTTSITFITKSTDKAFNAWNFFCKQAAKAVENWKFNIISRTYPDKKIVHLARHGKNHRIRKKNRDKIFRWFREKYRFIF